MLKKSIALPALLPIWVEDLKFTVRVQLEEEMERERMGRGQKRKSRETGCSVRMQLEIADRKKEESRA